MVFDPGTIIWATSVALLPGLLPGAGEEQVLGRHSNFHAARTGVGQPLHGHVHSHDAANQHMSHLLIGLSLAFVGSVALNASYLIQHVGSAATPTIAFRHPMRTLGSLLRSPLWLAGGVIGITGWAISIAALTQAPLSFVQAFLIGGIALLAPVAVQVLGHRLTPRELAGISLTGLRPSPTSRCCGGLHRVAVTELGRVRVARSALVGVGAGRGRLRSNLDSGPESPALNRPKRLVAA